MNYLEIFSVPIDLSSTPCGGQVQSGVQSIGMSLVSSNQAARKASTSEKEGKTEDAETWRRIEAALKLMRGPHQK